MTSLPPLAREGMDPLTQSLAVNRRKALGGKRVKTRLSPGSEYRFNYQQSGEETGKIGPRTFIPAPISLLGRVLSEHEFRQASTRFPLTSHKEKRLKPAPTSRKVVSEEPSFIQEIQRQTSNKDCNLCELTAKLKGFQQAVTIKCTKSLGDGHRPEAREGASLVVVNRKMYLFGGRCRMLFNDVKMLDCETLKWKAQKPRLSLEGPPEPRVNHTAVAYKNLMVVYGGGDRFNDLLQFRNCFQLLHCYDTSKFHSVTDTWLNAKPAGISPEPRRCHCATVVGKMMVFYGGIDRVGKTMEDLQAVDLVLKRVKPGGRSNATLTAVYSPMAFSVSNWDMFNSPKLYDEVFTPNTCGVYLFGGKNDHGNATNDVYLLKPRKKSDKEDRSVLVWQRLEVTGAVPEPRHSHSTALCGKYLFIVGGRNDGRDGPCEVPGIALLNVESQRWDRVEVMGKLPSARWGACMAPMGSRVIFFGGQRIQKYCGSKVFILELLSLDPLPRDSSHV